MKTARGDDHQGRGAPSQIDEAISEHLAGTETGIQAGVRQALGKLRKASQCRTDAPRLLGQIVRQGYVPGIQRGPRLGQHAKCTLFAHVVDAFARIPHLL